MTFNSLEYAAFLPIVFIIYWFVFGRHLKLQNLFVVAASYFFYGMWDWRFLILILFTSLCSWTSGLLIGKLEGNRRKAKIINALNIAANLSVLALFKYFNFFVVPFAHLLGIEISKAFALKVILPVGISFYTFQALSYSIDVYRGKIQPTKDLVAFLAYVSFFPQLVAGPIERATNLLPQFLKEREFEYSQAVEGLRQILWGLFKKVVIADNCALFVDEVFSTFHDQSGSTLLLAAVMFAFQIYGDFSGYSDIAIGSAKLFGIKLMRNFNVPYFSRNIAEFWKRWHISLNTWFVDYLYIPLGGSRRSKLATARNVLIIFLVSGLWHGAGWTFVAWGLYHALLFLPLILTGRNHAFRGTVAQGRSLPTLKEMSQMLATFFLVVAGWILFRSDSISQAFEYFRGIFSASLFDAPFFMKPSFWHPLTAAILVMTVIEWVGRDKEYSFSCISIPRRAVRYALYAALVLAIVLLNPGTGNQFIYFQF